MASSVLRAVACASALGASAVALSRQPEGLRQAVQGGGPPSEQGALGKASAPLAADLERWAQGPLFSEKGSLHHAVVGSRSGHFNLTIATFDPSVDQKVSGAFLAGMGWENDQNTEMCGQFRKAAMLPPGTRAGNFLDVGANIGSFTIPMADCLRDSGRVIAVEGMPPIADHLAVGILANNLQNVDMYMYAVGAHDDPQEVTMSLNPVNKGGSAVKGNKPFTEMSNDQLQELFHRGKHEHNVSVEEYEVPLTTGDRLLASNPALKAILVAKVGIQGHEGHFLEGSQRLFSQFPPCIMTIELVPDWLKRAGTPVEDILNRLAGWGYSDVPTAALLRASNTQGKTRTITQKNFTACLERVRTYAPESNVRPEINYSDPNALSAILAREARGKELDAMLVPGPPISKPQRWVGSQAGAAIVW